MGRAGHCRGRIIPVRLRWRAPGCAARRPRLTTRAREGPDRLVDEPRRQDGLARGVYCGWPRGRMHTPYKTHALLGQLLIEGANTLCSDKSGNIWTSTTNRNGSQMLEYAPGGTQPIAELFLVRANSLCGRSHERRPCRRYGRRLDREAKPRDLSSGAGAAEDVFIRRLAELELIAPTTTTGNLVIQGENKETTIYAELESGW